MHTNSLRHRALALVVGITVLAFSGWASADPPSRVARLGYVSGAVSFSPAGEDDWVQATLNRPLTTGDRLWADPGARAEVQIGGAMVRMNAATSVSILNLDDQITQLQLTQGALNVRVLRLERDQTFEVNTPNVAFTLRQPGEYRIEVDPEGYATTIVVRRGQGEVYGEDRAFMIDSQQPYRFMGTGLREYQHAGIPQSDDFDRWSRARDRSYDASVSARYVSPDVVGYQDLDANGTWRVDATYGNVWFPSRVAVGWAPYREGHWAWVHPWGWTWIDDAPWGFAVSHYGRWANLHGNWGWVPGPVRTRAYYAPALVVFIGGANFQLSISTGNVGAVAWFPLGPREVFHPAYPVSRRYYEDINRSNTVISNTVINNTYNNINVTNVVYANQRVPGAVVAVPTAAFVQSQPVSRTVVQVSQEVVVRAPVTVVPVTAPTERSVRGNAAERNRPPARALERPVVARTAPPPAPVGFAAQQPQLTASPGKPLDEATRRQLKPAVAAPAVKVIEAKVAPPTTRLPPAPGPADARGKSDDRKSPASAPVAEPKVAPPAPAAQPPQQRERDDQPGKGNQQRAPSPPVAAPAPPAPAEAAPAPKAAPPSPVARPPEQRERADQPGKGNQQRAPSPPVAAPAPSAPAQVAPAPTAAPLPPVARPPEQRERSDQPGKGSQQRAPSPPVAAPALPGPAQVAPAPKAAPPQPVAQPPEQRERADQPGKGNQQRAPSPPVAAPAPPPAAPQVKAGPAPTAAPPAPVARPPEQRDKAEQPGKGGQRTPPAASPPPPPPTVPKAAVPPVPKVAPPAGEVSASKSADLKKEAEMKKAKDKEKGKEEPKP